MNLELVGLAQKGDERAQAELVRHYRLRVQGYVRSIIGPQPAVEDVSQMVFIKMFRALAGLREIESFEPWLFCLTRNGARDYLRRARLRATTPLSDQEWNALAAEGDQLGRSQLARDVRMAIDRLTARDQELISMVIEGHCQQLIARRQSTTVSAIKARLRRLRFALKSALEHLWNETTVESSGAAKASMQRRVRPLGKRVTKSRKFSSNDAQLAGSAGLRPAA
ncbi:MAG TPA: RNA polymerase sigma factor [Opitutaceae bacterium]|nr:RNA polymerase sigma factor [Opitutaceae bacterium]